MADAPPPRWRTVVGTLALTELVSWGILYYAFGALVPAMQAELGWSQGFLGGAFSLALFVSALLAVPVGRWLDRHGPRGLMTLGSCAGALLVAAWAEVEHPLAFYVLFALLGFPLAGVLYEAAFGALVGFLGSGRRTDKALLLLTIVAGFASTVFVPVTRALERELGWRGALWALAAGLALATVPLHALVLPRDRAAALPGDPGRAPEGGAAAGGGVEARRLYLCAAAFALATVAGTSLGVYQVPILVEQGHGATVIAAAATVFGLGQACGRLLFTWLRPRYALATWSGLLFAPCALGLVAVATGRGAATSLAGIFLFALASGGQTLGRAAWALGLFPVVHFARVNGVLGLWSLLGRAGAPLALGAAHDWTGSHRPGLVALALLSLLGGALAWRSATGRVR
ncbi:MAG TPA: MFS transporter [Planctomycetota bacterium]